MHILEGKTNGQKGAKIRLLKDFFVVFLDSHENNSLQFRLQVKFKRIAFYHQDINQ